eukprot:tig00021687_g23115.t1
MGPPGTGTLVALSSSNALAPPGTGGMHLERLRALVREHGAPPPYDFKLHEAAFKAGQLRKFAPAWVRQFRKVGAVLPRYVHLVLARGARFALHDAERHDPRDAWDPKQAISPAQIPPFEEDPRPSCYQTPAHTAFIDGEVEGPGKGMVAMGVVRRMAPDEPPPLHVSPLHTVDKKGADKFRLCLDAKRINRYIHLRAFRYQTLDQVIELLRRHPGCWFVSYDMRKGYYHIALCLLTAGILAFKWTFEGVTRYYTYEALPFGVAAACYIFTKVMRAFAKYWLALGIILCIYLDDGLFICGSYEEAILVSMHLRHLGVLLGITFSDKSDFEPSQDRVHLGLGLDTGTGNGYCFLPKKKIEKLLAVLELLRGASAAPAVELQRIAGSLNAARHAFVGTALVARPLSAAVALAEGAGSDPRARVPLGPLQQAVIAWLLQYLPTAPPAPLGRPASAYRLFTDASGSGYCAALDVASTREPLSLARSDFRGLFGVWPPEIAEEDNCWRELRAVLIAATELFPLLPAGSHVIARVDNASAVASALRGSVKEGMMDLALRLFSACIKAGVTLEAVHVRGKDNVIADAGSRSRAPTLHNRLRRRLAALALGRKQADLPHVHVNARRGAPFTSPLPAAGAVITVDWQHRPRFINWLCESGDQPGACCIWLLARQPGALDWRPLHAVAAARGWLLCPLPEAWAPRHLFYAAEGSGSEGLGRSPWPLWVCAPSAPQGLITALTSQAPMAEALLPSRPPCPAHAAADAAPRAGTAPAAPPPGPVGAGGPDRAPRDPALEARKAELEAAVEDWAQYALCERTQRAYDSIVARFRDFCRELGVEPLGIDAVRLYAAQLGLEGKQWSTVRKHLSAIAGRLAHEGHPLPAGALSSKALRGLQMITERAADQATVLAPSQVRAWLSTDDFLRRGVFVQQRDLALVLTMIFGLLRYDDACRRLRLDSVVEASTRGAPRPGLTLILRADKTNPARRGPNAGEDPEGCHGERTVTITDMPELGPLDATRALRHYLANFSAEERRLPQPLFINDEGEELSYTYVNNIPKRIATSLGLSPEDGYSSHSFRRSGTTWAALGGAEKRVLEVHGRWSHRGATAEQYIDAATELSGRACAHMSQYLAAVLPQ